MSGRGKKGFTLIELLVVLAILGAVAAITAPTYMKYIKRSRAIVTLSSVKDALKSLAKDTGRWPGGAPPYLCPKNLTASRNGSRYADLTAADIGIFNDKGNIFSDAGWKGPYMPESYLDPATGKFLDPWGTPYFMDYGYNVNGKWYVVIGSAGPKKRHKHRRPG